ncbi:TonB-dependent receptor family protein [Rheinheimera sp.]|uniref:TonB-dependent receptor family protein n=1 Tax=Rheinheimera sp. TaxID=1869214 RepID=UPI003AF4ADCE
MNNLVLAGCLPALLAPALCAQEQAVERIHVTAQSQSQQWLTDPSNAQHVQLNSTSAWYDAASLFNGVAGFQADSRANYAQDSRLSSRGFGSRSAFGIRGLRLLQDGIPLSAPDGQGQLSSVLLDQLDHLEVLTGPMAALYGNAAGGVVSLHSRKPEQDEASVLLSQSRFAGQQSLSVQQRYGDSSSRLSLKRAELQSQRPHSEAEKQQGQWIWFSPLEFADLMLRYDWSRDPLLQDPLGLTEAEWRADPNQTAANAERFDTKKSSRQRQLSLTLSQQQAEQFWQLGLWTGQRQVSQNLGFDGLSPTSAGGVVDLNRPFAGANALQQWQFGTLSLSLGASYEQSTDERKGYVNQQGQAADLRRDEKGKFSSTDWFSRFSYQLQPDWLLSGGVRHSKSRVRVEDFYINDSNPDDSGRTTFNEQSAAISLSHHYTANSSWFVSAGQGFETPTLTEMAYQNGGSGLNLALKPSQSDSVELGHKWQFAQWRSSLVLFRTDTNDELLADQSSGGRTTYKNGGKTEREGLEWLWVWQASPHWQQQLSLTLLNARFADGGLQGKQLPGVARQQLYWALSYLPDQTPDAKLLLSTTLRSKIASTDQNQSFAPGYARVDLRWQAELPLAGYRLSYELAAENLTDTDSVGAVVVNQTNGRAFEPALPRQFSASLRLSF